jgi:hypothetical protein
MKPEHPIIDPAIRADAIRARAKLPQEIQDIIDSLCGETLLLAGEYDDPHVVVTLLKERHPEAIEALDALQEIP